MQSIPKKISQKIILNLVYLLIKEVKGEQNIPKSGGYIVASNHASHIDPLTIGSVIFKRHKKITRYIGKKESLNNFIGRFIYNTFDVIPIDRSSKSKKELLKALKFLKKDLIVGIFPEGTRTSNGKIQKGKTGVAWLTIYSKKTVLPVAIKNTFELWSKNQKLPKLKRIIKINIGKPLNFSIKNRKISKKVFRDTTNMIMKQIADLYIDLKQ